jgi:hypothetical protein
VLTRGVPANNWLFNNIFGIAFSVVGIEQIVLPSFKTGAILLWGLFFYDVRKYINFSQYFNIVSKKNLI